MMIDATRDDLERIRDLLVRANDAPYDIAPVAEEKCFGDGVAGRPAVRVVRIGGAFAGVSVTCGIHLRILAVDRAHRGRGIGAVLLRDAEARGIGKIAAEPGNYFTPGLSLRDRATVAFFRARGYREIVTTQNLETGDLPRSGPENVRRAVPADRERVLAFVERHFGAGWRLECERAAALHFVEQEGGVAGFSAADANNRGLGWFGPTGVAPELRGRGHGRALLLASLAALRRLGYQRAVIPWTDAVAFYKKTCRARVTEQFVILGR